MAMAALDSEAAARADLKRVEALLDRALSADEADRIGEALTLYAEAEGTAASLGGELPPNSDLRRRLDVYRANIRARTDHLVRSLDAAQPPPRPSAPPPYEATAPPATAGVRVDWSGSNGARADAEVLLTVAEAQMCSVTAEGEVGVPSYPAPLLVCSLRSSGMPFLRLGEWTCPLVPGETPALLTGEDRCTLMLPDPQSLRRGDSVALLLSPAMGAGDRAALLNLLSRLTRLMVSDGGAVRPLTDAEMGPVPAPPPYHSSASEAARPRPRDGTSSQGDRTHTSDRVARGIGITSGLIARGLVWGADKGSGLIRRGSEALRNHLEQQQEQQGPPREVPVDPRVERGAEVARSGTNTVVNTTERAVGVIGGAAKSLAKWAGPHIRKGAGQVLPTTWTQPSEPGGRSRADSALTVASAALASVGTVYEALERGAKCVGRATADGTSGVVGTKYGPSAGRTTSNVLYSVGNVGLTLHTLHQLGLKAMGLATASSATHGAAAAVPGAADRPGATRPIGPGDKEKKEEKEKRPASHK